MSQPQRLLSTLPAIAVAATGVLLVAGCSSSSTAPSTQPSINFGSQASVTPGNARRRHRKCIGRPLVNTLNLKKLGHLGNDQLDFIRKDVAQLSSDTPIVVFSHIPLFAMHPDWGWSTEDAAQALSYLKRFSSVTCLNGHVHQLFSKTEGNVTFYSGTTTAYPLPHPGDGPAPKPTTLPAGKLHNALGIRQVSYTKGQQALALKEQTLS
jgi:3',5'-cyclic AMP phosphodiesterase CpdA